MCDSKTRLWNLVLRRERDRSVSWKGWQQASDRSEIGDSLKAHEFEEDDLAEFETIWLEDAGLN
jgi:hypothetical protein